MDRIKGTATVGSLKPSVLGFYDLRGNVGEWVWDGLDEKTVNRVIRGGHWGISGGSCLVCDRKSRPAGDSNGVDGLRVALSSAP